MKVVVQLLLSVIAGFLLLVPLASGAQATTAGLSPLRVLYVGNDPKTVQIPKADLDEHPEHLLALKRARSGHFEDFLRQHFATVRVVFGPQYTEALSADYDVTIFDALPPAIKKRVLEEDPKTGRLLRYEPAQYLSAGFDRAALLIADVSPQISEPLAYKMDWLCRCLEAYAHDMNLAHPIFNTPNAVHPTIEVRPTPKNYRVYYSGRDLPDTLPMWRVQKESFSDGKGFPPGIVSTGPGFADAKDAEVISSGVCEKERGSVALARHGNFFHWGFSADPEGMTEQGRLVFVNAIHYIAQFNGQHPYSRRPNRYGPTREWALNLAYFQLHDSYSDYVEHTRKDKEGQREYLRRLQKVRQLSESELRILNEPTPTPLDQEQWLKQEILGRWPESVVAQLGTDLSKYLPYIQENLEYLKPGTKERSYEVDEDVRSLAVSNRSIQLLDLCVAMLESNTEADKAQRLLERYTGEHFKTASDWRGWLESHRQKLYFSDEDEFRFHSAP